MRVDDVPCVTKHAQLVALSNWVEPAAREYDTRLEANDDQLQYVLTKSGGRHSYGTGCS